MKRIGRDGWIILSIGYARAYCQGAAIPLATWAFIDWSLLLACICALCLIVARIATNEGQKFEFRRIPEEG